MGGVAWRLSQGTFRVNPPVSLVPTVSLLVGFPDRARGLARTLSRHAALDMARRRKHFHHG